MSEHEDNHETIRRVLNEKFGAGVDVWDGKASKHLEIHEQVHKAVNILQGGERIWWCKVHKSQSINPDHTICCLGWAGGSCEMGEVWINALTEGN